MGKKCKQKLLGSASSDSFKVVGPDCHLTFHTLFPIWDTSIVAGVLQPSCDFEIRSNTSKVVCRKGESSGS